MDADQFTDTVHPGPIDSSVLTQQDQHRSTKIWQGEDLAALKCRRGDGSIPWSSIDQRVVPYLIKAGFYGIYRIGAIKYDWALINALVERWRVETHTFHLPIGEATITLQDVEVLLGLPIEGDTISGIDSTYSTEEWQEICDNLFGVVPPSNQFTGRMLNLKWLMEHVHPLSDYATDVSVQYYARALILAMIGGIVMPNLSGSKVDLKYFVFLQDLDMIGSLSWGSAALAYLYRELCRATNPNNIQIGGCLTLLQVWVWERIQCMRPNIEYGLQYVTQIDPPGPSGYKWRAAKDLEDVSTHVLRVYRDQLDLLTDNQFEWQPYQLEELPHYCRQGENIWRSRVPLICYDRVEWHFPDRVLRQFGLWQDIPVPCDTGRDIHNIDLRGRNDVDWTTFHEDYQNLWEIREELIVMSNEEGEHVGCSDAYKIWYRNITRVLISNPFHRHQSDVIGYMGISGGYEGLIQELQRINHLLGEFHIDHDVQKVTDAQGHVVSALALVGEQERLAGQVPPTYAYNAPPTELRTSNSRRKRRAVPRGPATSDAPGSSSVPPPPHNTAPTWLEEQNTQVECVTQVGSQAEPSNRGRRLPQRVRREPNRYTPSVPPPTHNTGFVPPPHNTEFAAPTWLEEQNTQVEGVTQVGSQAEASNRGRRLPQRVRREPNRYTPSK